MRRLLKEQKSLLNQICHERGNVMDSSDLTVEEIEELERLNDYETMLQDINRFIIDLRMDLGYNLKKHI